MPIDPQRYLLSEAEAQQIFQERIIPAELAHGVSQDEPVVVFIAGQPGAGKTKTTEAVKDRLDQRGGAIVVNSDFYKPFHPAYARLLAEDDRTAAPYTSMDGRRWMAAAERYLIDRRVDVIVETTMRDPGDFLEPAAMFREAGYRVETAIMAVPEPLSRLGIVHRYHEQVQSMGHGRLTARENHDASYEGVLDASTVIDVERIVDAVHVYRRGNVPLYANELDADGVWTRPAEARQAVEVERTRQWTPEETKQFADNVALLGRDMDSSWHPELADITVRARTLADPQIPLPELHPSPDLAPAPGDEPWPAGTDNRRVLQSDATQSIEPDREEPDDGLEL